MYIIVWTNTQNYDKKEQKLIIILVDMLQAINWNTNVALFNV